MNFSQNSLWNVGIDESCLTTLAGVLKSIPSIKTVALEANPIPEAEPFYLLIENNPSWVSMVVELK